MRCGERERRCGDVEREEEREREAKENKGLRHLWDGCGK